MDYAIKIGDYKPTSKTGKFKLTIDPVTAITLTIVLCGAVYILYTVRNFDLATKQVELVKEKLEFAKASDKSKALARIHLGFQLNADDKFWTYAPLHQPIGKHFEYLLDRFDKTTMKIYHKGAYINKNWTPAQLGLSASDVIKIELS